MRDIFTTARPLIHLLPPETAHHAGLALLRHGCWPHPPAQRFFSLEQKVFGLDFANPVGLAAGFDKNAVAIDGLLAQGFGFVEAGTVTPRAQVGNAKPRIFRLPEDRAVINRLGFNNDGLNRFVESFRRRNKSLGVAGANIGKNKDSDDAVADYEAGMRAVYPHADYITINISSPNTQGLRALQQREALTGLLSAMQKLRNDCARQHGRRVPYLLKVAPDLDYSEMEAIVEVVLSQGVDGMIISNTTVTRPESLRSGNKNEQGGLSGAPLMALSTSALQKFYALTGGKIPLIGAGGIASADDAYAKIKAGATLVQLYTALVYQGFAVVRNIQKGLAERLQKDGFKHISEAIGTGA